MSTHHFHQSTTTGLVVINCVFICIIHILSFSPLCPGSPSSILGSSGNPARNFSSKFNSLADISSSSSTFLRWPTFSWCTPSDLFIGVPGRFLSFPRPGNGTDPCHGVATDSADRDGLCGARIENEPCVSLGEYGCPGACRPVWTPEAVAASCALSPGFNTCCVLIPDGTWYAATCADAPISVTACERLALAGICHSACIPAPTPLGVANPSLCRMLGSVYDLWVPVLRSSCLTLERMSLARMSSSLSIPSCNDGARDDPSLFIPNVGTEGPGRMTPSARCRSSKIPPNDVSKSNSAEPLRFCTFTSSGICASF